MTFSFAGFSLPNAVLVPEEVFHLLPDLSGVEVKVLLFLLQKQDATIPEIAAGTGLSRPAVTRGLHLLEGRGCLETSQVATERNRKVNIYRIRFRQ